MTGIQLIGASPMELAACQGDLFDDLPLAVDTSFSTARRVQLDETSSASVACFLRFASYHSKEV